MSETGHPNVNGLRVVADFNHRFGSRQGDRSELERVYREFTEVLTAMEAFTVLFNELECQQIRADYVKCLLEPHVERAARAVTALGALL